MKSKPLTYFLIVVVIGVWGIIFYRIIDGLNGDNEDNLPVTSVHIQKEPYNEFNPTKDTTHLLLNYRDPFGIIKQKDTAAFISVKKLTHRDPAFAVQKLVVNWNFIQYSGYIKNPVSKKLYAMLTINGKSEVLTEGQQIGQVKLLKNLRDSVKISFNGKIKFITIKPAA